MARRRLGVAVVLDPPVAEEVDGLRRALGDTTLAAVPPHLTLVSPVNVRVDDVAAALAVLRRSAATVGGPLRLALGPPVSFLPDNPVVYLPVAGDLPALTTLHGAVAAGPLLRSRPASWPWVPHVTLVDGPSPDRLASALEALAHYSAVVDVDRVVLLEQRPVDPGAGGGQPPRPGVPTRRWVELADAALGPAAVVGRGGLELRITRGRLAGPDLVAVAGPDLRSVVSAVEPPGGGRGGPGLPIVLTAEREGTCVGGAFLGWVDQRPTVAVVVAEPARRSGVGAALLAHLEWAARQAGWVAPNLHGVGPPGFYRACSTWTVA